MDDDSRYDRWEQGTEIPLFLASLLFLAAYAARVLAVSMPSGWKDLCGFTMLALWLVFAADYVVRWRLSGQHFPHFVRTHFLHTVVVLLPCCGRCGSSRSTTPSSVGRGSPGSRCTRG